MGSQISNNIVSVALSQAMNNNHGSSFSSNTNPTSNPSVIVHPNEYSFQNSPGSANAATSVTVDLPSLSSQNSAAAAANAASEENGVLLCNLDDLSRYIPENFYSDFTLGSNDNHHSHSQSQAAGPPQFMMSDYLQTVVAGKAVTTTTVSSVANPTSIHLQPPSQVHGLQSQTGQAPPQSITIHLPTQPQPIQGVKTVTYAAVNKSGSPSSGNQAVVNPAVSSPSMSPGKITQYAFTPSGERIAIHGLPPEATKPGSTLQVQVKGGGVQTLQLSAVEPNHHHHHHQPSKLTVVQELQGEVGKVVIQESKPVGSDSISSILEEMKQEEGGMINTTADGSNLAEYATAIPVAVSSDSGRKTTTIKRVAAPASTVFLPAASMTGSSADNTSTGNKSRLIFAGNTLPQGAIPIQINGLNAIPISAVKSLPFSLNSLTSSPPNNTNVISMMSNTNTTQARKPASKPTAIKSGSGTMVTKVSNNNGGNSGFHKVQSNNMANINKAIGNNKTCNWVFENGEVCGKTFSKSYNLVVHMRMHEDVRPFGCSLCDQTFRQKAHLQRHETTHGIGVKISNRSSGNAASASNSSSGGGAPRRKRKRSSRGSTGSSIVNPASHSPPVTHQSPVMSANLQQRLARVNEQFGTIKDEDIKDDIIDHLKEAQDNDKLEQPPPKMRRLSVRLDRCDVHLADDSSSGPDPNAAFQPYIATPEEAAAAAEDVAQTTSHVLVDAAVNVSLTAAVNEAISGIQEAMM